MASSLIRLRMFIGLTTMLHGLGGPLIDSCISELVLNTTAGALWSWLLILGGLVTFVAATYEACYHRRTWGAVTGTALLGCLWIAVGYHSMQDGRVGVIALLSPAYVVFCAWSWQAVAVSQRREVLADQQPTYPGAEHDAA